MPTAAEVYAARVAAYDEQRHRLLDRSGGDRYGGDVATRFRADPHRDLDPNTAAIAALVGPEDTVIDVGGGAGRTGLALAARCRGVINVDPSPSMGQHFQESAAAAGLTNAQLIPSLWPPLEPLHADFVLTQNVTYFVRDIVPFLQAMQQAAHKRVAITVWSSPPPTREAALFPLVFGEPLALVPGHRELLPVLWEMDILPEVRLLPRPMTSTFFGAYPTREAAIDTVLGRLAPKDPEQARAALTAHFDEVFFTNDQGVALRIPPNTRELLITWDVDEPDASV